MPLSKNMVTIKISDKNQEIIKKNDPYRIKNLSFYNKVGGKKNIKWKFHTNKIYCKI